MTRPTVGMMILVAVVTALVAPGTAAGQPEPPEPNCDADADDDVVVLFETGSTAGDSPVTPGTTLYVYLCNGGDTETHGTVWDLGGDTGFEQAASGEDYVEILVSAEPSRTVRLGELVGRRDASGGTFTIADTNEATWTGRNDTESEAVELQFSNKRQRAAFERQADNLSQAYTDLDNLLAPLQTDQVRRNNVTVSEIPPAVRRIEAETTALHRSAFDTTRTGDTTKARAVIDNSETDLETTRQRTRESLRDYRNQLQTGRDAETRRVRLLFGGGALVGLVTGVGGGFVSSRRTRRRLIRQRSVDSSVQIRLQEFRLPLIIAVSCVLAGIGYGLVRSEIVSLLGVVF